MTGHKLAEPPRCCEASSRHRWKWCGRPDRSWCESSGLEVPDCERPALMRCGCGEQFLSRCQATGRAKCGPCSESYRRRVKIIAGSGLVVLPSTTYVLTLTAPGTKRHKRGRSGLWCPCTAEGGVDLGQWNGTMATRWNHFITDVRRTFGGCEYFAAKEVQARGALHLHVPIRFDNPTGVTLGKLRALAIRHGFGHELHLDDLAKDHGQAAAERIAWYVAKYCAKASDARADAPFVHPRTGEVGPGRWRLWTSSRKWGESMLSVRQAQRAWWQQQQSSSAGGGPGEPRPGEADSAGVGGAGALDPNTMSYATAGSSIPVAGRSSGLL